MMVDSPPPTSPVKRIEGMVIIPVNKPSEALEVCLIWE